MARFCPNGDVDVGLVLRFIRTLPRKGFAGESLRRIAKFVALRRDVDYRLRRNIVNHLLEFPSKDDYTAGKREPARKLVQLLKDTIGDLQVSSSQVSQ